MSKSWHNRYIVAQKLICCLSVQYMNETMDHKYLSFLQCFLLCLCWVLDRKIMWTMHIFRELSKRFLLDIWFFFFFIRRFWNLIFIWFSLFYEHLFSFVYTKKWFAANNIQLYYVTVHRISRILFKKIKFHLIFAITPSILFLTWENDSRNNFFRS